MSCSQGVTFQDNLHLKQKTFLWNHIYSFTLIPWELVTRYFLEQPNYFMKQAMLAIYQFFLNALQRSCCRVFFFKS